MQFMEFIVLYVAGRAGDSRKKNKFAEPGPGSDFARPVERTKNTRVHILDDLRL